jgi:cytochrome oxidase assembly protein ShyY1
MTGKISPMSELILAKTYTSASCISSSYYTQPSLTTNYRTIVFINRGWVDSKATEWNRPEGTVTMTTIISEVERVSNTSISVHKLTIVEL